MEVELMCENLTKIIVDTHECFGCEYSDKNGHHTEPCKSVSCDDGKHFYHFVKNVNKIETDNVNLTKEAQRLRKDLR